MSYYFIAHIRIHDEEEYRKYLENADDVFDKYNGKYLVVDDNPEIIEGTYKYTRTVIIEFKSKSDFEAWYYSVEYQEILKYRLRASHSDTTLAKGITSE